VFDRDLLAALEELEAEYVNLGLYAARVSVADLRQRLASRHPDATAAEIVAALARQRAEGEVIEWRPAVNSREICLVDSKGSASSQVWVGSVESMLIVIFPASLTSSSP